MQTFEIPFFDHSVRVAQSERGLLELAFQNKKASRSVPQDPQSQRVAAQVKAFLAGERQDLGLTIDWKGLKGTDFQKTVWKKMAKIPYGKTKTYGAIAQSLNSPGAARAVGTACAKNPVLLAIPCHRVVGASGLGGFSGGGLGVKRQLLDLESPRA